VVQLWLWEVVNRVHEMKQITGVEKCWWPHISTDNLATSWEDWRLCLFEKEENNKS
jgi:hypothetical protein